MYAVCADLELSNYILYHQLRLSAEELSNIKAGKGKKWNHFCDRAELSNLCENLKYQVVNIAEISAKLTTIKI